MDLTTLNLTPEQMTALEGHIGEVTTKAKEGLISKEDLTKLTQAEGDKVRTEYSKKLKDTADELNKYKPKQKSEAEIELENRLKVLEDKEKEVQGKEKLLDITTKLNEQGLPSQLGKYLTGVEDVETEINSLKEVFNNLKIDGSFKPDKHNKGAADFITKEQFLKMSYMERMNLFKSNKDLYDRLSK